MQGRLIFVTTCHFFGSMCHTSFGWRNSKTKYLQSTTLNSEIPWNAGQGSEKNKDQSKWVGAWLLAVFFTLTSNKIKQYNLSVNIVRLCTVFTALESWFYLNNNCYKWHSILFYSLVGQCILSCWSNVLDTLSLIS